MIPVITTAALMLTLTSNGVFFQIIFSIDNDDGSDFLKAGRVCNLEKCFSKYGRFPFVQKR